MKERRIETKKGLQELLRRYQEAGANQEWILTVQGCISDNLAMDGTDWENTPVELRRCWVGLK